MQANRQMLLDEVWRLGGRIMKPPRTRGADGRWNRDRAQAGTDHGEWDWFYSLPEADRVYVQAHHMVENGVHPDVVATELGVTVEEAMAQWVGAILAARAAGTSRRDPLEGWEDDEAWAHRWDDLPDYIGTAGIAVILDVSDATPRQWRVRGKLPEPTYLVDGMHPIWSRADIGAWFDQIAACSS